MPPVRRLTSTKNKAQSHEPTARPSKTKSHKTSDKEKSSRHTSSSLKLSSSSTSKSKDKGKASSSEENAILCGECGKSFEQLHKFNKHMKTHELPHRCPYEGCPETKASNKEITRHVWASHKKWAKDTEYPTINGSCPRCGISFTRADNMKQHRDKGRCKGGVE